MAYSGKALKGAKIIITVGEFDVPYNEVPENVKYEKFVQQALSEKGISSETVFLEHKDFDNKENLRNRILNVAPDIVFNLFEGFYDDSSKEPVFAEVLEELKIPYTGNSAHALRTCLNKQRTKDILKENGLPVPQGFVIYSVDDLKKQSPIFPVFMKPVAEDASLGIDKESLAMDMNALISAAGKKLKAFPAGILAEEFLYGQEFNVGVVGNGEYEVFGVSVIDYSGHEDMPFLTYSSKWDEQSEEYRKTMPVFEKGIDQNIRKNLLEMAAEAGRALKCKGYFRVDFRAKGEKIYIIDVNPNPDISPDAGFAKQAAGRGYSYPDVIKKILDLAWN
ncbi:MAG TPA: ATP-grasp domain-containing protein [Candidatus Omnitrophota bacterium]|nr:ATP-grasp domain-containing protein [Candidatus Omnitrophota bacterium]HPS20650.1 ATP-grasp domain-containing protein [Candidatus Omnitrophota bacterium]